MNSTSGSVPPPTLSLTEEELEEARRGGPEAPQVWERIYLIHSDELVRFFRTRIGDEYEAEDMASQTIMEAMQKLPGFRGKAEKFRAWLYRIALNDVIDHRRKLKRRRTEALDASPESMDEAARALGGADPQDVAMGHLQEDAIMSCLNKLSPEQRDVIHLRIVADLPAQDVAEAMGKSVGSVKALQHRGLKSLVRILEERERQSGTPRPMQAAELPVRPTAGRAATGTPRPVQSPRYQQGRAGAGPASPQGRVTPNPARRQPAPTQPAPARSAPTQPAPPRSAPPRQQGPDGHGWTHPAHLQGPVHEVPGAPWRTGPAPGYPYDGTPRQHPDVAPSYDDPYPSSTQQRLAGEETP